MQCKCAREYSAVSVACSWLDQTQLLTKLLPNQLELVLAATI